MIRIIDGIINVHHGDDCTIPVTMSFRDGTAYTMQDGDKLKFTVRATPDHASAILLEIESEEPYITVTHDLMENIPAGKYSCDIQLTRSNGMVTTIYPKLRGTGSTANLKNFVVDAEVSD